MTIYTAAKTPSETIGHYAAYGQHRVIYELLLIALDVVKFLEKKLLIHCKLKGRQSL